MPDNNVGIRIRELRELRGLSGGAFAEKVDITTKYLYEIEEGKRNFSSDVLRRMAENLGVSCDYIMFGKDNSERLNMEVIALLEKMNERQITSIQKILKVLCEISDTFEIQS